MSNVHGKKKKKKKEVVQRDIPVRSRPLDEVSRSISISGRGLIGGELELRGTNMFSFRDDVDPYPKRSIHSKKKSVH